MADVEKCAPAPAATVAAAPDGTSTGGVLRRWRSQDLLDRSVSALRAAAWVFSLLAFVVMASNEHGDLMKFNLYKEYRYIVAVGVLAFTYTTLQLLRQGVRLSGGQDLQPKAGLLVDFAGDQVTAYLMMSALSAAIPITNYMREASAAMREVADYLVPDSSAAMREGADNVFTNSAAASISMAFLAFVCLALSALISGFKLAKQTYI